MAARFWVGGTGTWDASDTTHWAATSGGAGGASVPTTNDTVTFDGSSGGGTCTLGANTASLGAVTFVYTNGTLDFASYKLTCASFGASNSVTRAVDFNTGILSLTGTGTIFTMATATNLTVSYSAGSYIEKVDSSSTACIINGGTRLLPQIRITAGSAAMTFTGVNCAGLDWTGATGSWATASNAMTIRGNVTLASGMSNLTDTNAITLGDPGADGTYTFTANGKTLACGITVSSASNARIYNFVDTFTTTGALNVTVNSKMTTAAPFTCASMTVNAAGTVAEFGNTLTTTGAITLNQITFSVGGTLTCGTLTMNIGTFQFNNYDVYCTSFTRSATGSTTYYFGTSNIYLSGTGTILSISSATGYSASFTTTKFIKTSSSASACTFASASGAFIPAIVLAAGSGAITFTGINCNGLDWTAATGSWSTSSNAFQCHGHFLMSSGMSDIAETTIITFGAPVDDGTYTIDFAGKTTVTPLTFASTSANKIWQLASDVTSAGALTLTSGGLDLQSYTLTGTKFTTSNSNVRSITGTGTIVLTSTGTIWSAATSTNLTLGTGFTIKATNSSVTAKTFTGGSKTYGNLWINCGSTGTFTIQNNNTFNDIKIDNPPRTVLFTASSTQTVASFTAVGTAGNEITINSTSTAIHNLVKTGGGVVSCDYLNIQHSVARPWSGASGADTWYAGDNSTNNQAVATAGNGWIFTAAPPTGTEIKTINNLAKASVKTFNGLAIASVKSINGLE